MALGKLFYWRPEIEEFCKPLRCKQPFDLLFSKLPRGIDNTRIDVVLSQEFTQKTRLMVKRALLHDVTKNYWGEAPPPPDKQDVQAVGDCYIGMMELAVDRARKRSSMEVIQLLQFSVLKFLLQVIDEELRDLRSRLQKERSRANQQSNALSVQLHERLVILAKEESSIRYRLSRRLFRELLKLETVRLGKLRKSVLGRTWPVPKIVLFNPMLQLSSLLADEQLMKHYPLACTNSEKERGFDTINRLVVGLFSRFLPTWVWPLEGHEQGEGGGGEAGSTAILYRNEPGGMTTQIDIGLLLGNSMQKDEYHKGLVSWLDVPENIDRFIYSVKSGSTSVGGDSGVADRAYWQNPHWPQFHARLLKRLLRQFKKGGLEQEILASHAAPEVYQDLKGCLPVRLVCQYLAGDIKKQGLQRKLSGMPGVNNPVQVMKVLDRAQSAIRNMPTATRRRRVFSFVRHFSIFRRDLKLAHQAFSAMSRIRILSRQEDIDLSRSNSTLQEMLLRGELQPGEHKIRNHVIIKADVRGSTAITKELRQRGLNPASHFSLNFFEPITRLLKGYGAQKVFVEGDAVILSIFEYQDTPYQWLCVSHACGLARNMLKVVEAQNIKNREYGLPELELGLGICFSDEEPTFLYDGNQKIMISPAINRADQLSSCSAAIRNTRYGRALGQGVKVMAPLDAGALEKVSSDKLVRYNVNGIELDISAYYKLKSELSMRTVEQDMLAGDDQLMVGRYPDLDGKMHTLVLKESPVTVWDGLASGENEPLQRSYYQVVTDRERRAEAVERLSPRAAPP
ncbi:MAG: hypothetical protein RPU72_06140 [Candidatus Sedimenticola sp. (ex Thyasira tokunagai)]